MKKLNSFFLLLALVSLTVMASCGGNGGDDTPELTAEEQRIVDLAGTASGVSWATTSVTFDGSSSDFFEDLVITFRGSSATNLTYTSSNGSPLFGATGTWEFNGTNLNQVIFDGDESNIYTISLNASATPSTLTMTVNYTSDGGVAAGVNGASGTYVINLEEQ